MFTGMIEEIGTIRSVRKGNTSGSLTIEAGEILSGVKIGDSIAVNGICLTVTGLEGSGFTVDVMHETFDRSNGAMFQAGMRVNLERAMAADGRFGGHIVMGHADGLGKILRRWRDDTAIWYTIQAKPQIMRYIVEKGSIAVDGISLTVAAITQEDFSVSVIPHTVKETVLKERREGDFVNLETDVIGKYVEKLLCPVGASQEKSTITKEFLTQYGF